MDSEKKSLQHNKQRSQSERWAEKKMVQDISNGTILIKWNIHLIIFRDVQQIFQQHQLKQSQQPH